MRIAVIDLGTNTFILLIAERQNGNIVPIYQQEAFVKLGEGVDQYKILKQSAIERGLAQLAVFLKSPLHIKSNRCMQQEPAPFATR